METPLIAIIIVSTNELLRETLLHSWANLRKFSAVVPSLSKRWERLRKEIIIPVKSKK